MKKRRIGLSIVVKAVVSVLAGCGGPLDDSPVAYRVAMDGRPVATDLAATVSWPAGEYAGLIVHAAFCDDTGYLLTPEVVHRVDLASGTVTGRLGRRGQGPGEWIEPSGLAIDCDHETLYVIDARRGLVALALDEAAFGQSRGLIPKPPLFMPVWPGNGGAAVVGGVVAVSGIWKADSGNVLAGPDLYEGMQLGWKASVGRPDGMPFAAVAAPIERGCFAVEYVCFAAPLDHFEVEGAEYLVVTQGASTRASVVDTAGGLVRAIDIRSPRFVRDGRRFAGQGTAAERMPWGETNSIVFNVFGWEGVLAVVHARHAEAWSPGQIVQYDVFLNLFSTTGDRLMSDARLPDVPIGRAAGNLYFADYGEAGRRMDFDRVDIRRLSLSTLSDAAGAARGTN